MKRTQKISEATSPRPGGGSDTTLFGSIEWLTVGLLVAVWITILLGTWLIGRYEIWWALLLLAPVITLHSSLVHEAIHGHPTRHPGVNEFLLTVNPGVFFPYGSFRDSHREHHLTEDLTDPHVDTESNLISADQWEALGPLGKWTRRINATLLGRLIMGPTFTLIAFIKYEARRLRADESTARRDLLWHLLGCIVVFYWVVVVCGIPAWAYVILAAYPSASLLALRTYAEHNPHSSPNRRTATVESGRLMSLLYLNNNLHTLHHEQPHLPWYRLRALYFENPDRYRSQQNFFSGYREIFRRFAFGAYSPVVHPMTVRD